MQRIQTAHGCLSDIIRTSFLDVLRISYCDPGTSSECFKGYQKWTLQTIYENILRIFYFKILRMSIGFRYGFTDAIPIAQISSRVRIRDHPKNELESRRSPVDSDHLQLQLVSIPAVEEHLKEHASEVQDQREKSDAEKLLLRSKLLVSILAQARRYVPN